MSKTNFIIKKDELKVVMERTFNAPREVLFNAFIDPGVITNWWGPAILEITIDKLEPKEGGAWRFLHKDSAGNEFAFNGVFKKIAKPGLITQTFNFEGIPGDHELLQTATFEENGGKTKVISTSVYKNIQDLEGMVASGMESGAKEGWERLAGLVERNSSNGYPDIANLY